MIGVNILSNVILGVIDNSEYRLKYTKENNKSKHMDVRKERLELTLENASPVYYYEVFRSEDNCRQVHCLYEDASLIIFNKDSGSIITIILLNRKELKGYLKTTKEVLANYPIMRRCAKIHERLVNGSAKNISIEDLASMKRKKLKYMND